MGRPQRITKEDVFHEIETNGTTKNSELAKALGCSKETIRNKIRSLQRDGLAILPTKEGYLFIQKVTTEDEAELVQQTVNWILGVAKALGRIGKVSRPHLIVAGKKLRLSRDEKSTLSHNSALLQYFANYENFEE